MKIKGTNENYYLSINRIGEENIDIEVGTILGNSISVIIHKKYLKKILEELK